MAQEKVSKFLLTLNYHFEYSLTEFFLATTTKASFTEPPASIPSQININEEDSSEDETWNPDTATKTSTVELTFDKEDLEEEEEEDFIEDDNLDVESLEEKKR